MSVIKCAHIIFNITLETPTRVEPYYVVLEKPTFSSIGVLLYPLMWLKDRITKFVPLHGMVLIYWRISGITNPDHRMFRIHLFLMPCNLSVEMDIHNQEKNLGYDRIRKPPQIDSLYIGKTYDVKASGNASVSPETLLFRCSYVSELYPYTEITVDGKNASEGIAISIEDGNISVWRAKVDRGDIMDLESAMSGLSVQEGAIGGMAGPSVEELCVSRQSTAMVHSYPVKGKLTSMM
ncbi:NACHT, LRR and PYD domains-containing protein 1a allele 5-like isoform X2 [Aquarana catesbeiana]